MCFLYADGHFLACGGGRFDEPLTVDDDDTVAVFVRLRSGIRAARGLIVGVRTPVVGMGVIVCVSVVITAALAAARAALPRGIVGGRGVVGVVKEIERRLTVAVPLVCREGAERL